MKKIKLSLLILILTLAIGLIIPLAVNAAQNATQIDPDDYESSGPTSQDVKDMYKFGGSIAGVVQIAGTMVSVGALAIIGIRYMIASSDEKAEYKERMFPYVIGATLLFGASNIVNILYKMFK